jgi:tetratricopeptide (TPR) repeat protein
VLRFSFLIYIAARISVWAHGDLHDQIVLCTEQIQRAPQNASLYIKRGELHRLHGEFELALSDCARAGELDGKLSATELVRGRTFADSGKLREAKEAFSRFVYVEPRHAEALLGRARVLAQLGEFPAADEDFTRAIANSSAPQPDWFLERAQTLIAFGKTNAAIAAVNEGIEKLGAIVSLEIMAIDLEVSQREFDSALRRIEKLSAQSGRKETWLVRRGEILQRAGKDDEARIAFRQALAAIESLPADRRETKGMKDLQCKANAALLEPGEISAPK